MSLNLKEQYEKIYKYCYFKVGNATYAEDLTQESFLRFFSQNSYLPRGKQLAYLYTIARNLCIDFYKSRKEEKLSDDYPSDEGVHDLETKLAIQQALSSLPPLEQELLLLRFVNQVSVGEICSITGLSRFVVYRKTTASLAKLKSFLKEEDFFE